MLLLPLVPTRVGMILRNFIRKCLTSTCPHTRGDEPYYSGNNFSSVNLSPHAWDVLTSLFCVLTHPDRKLLRTNPFPYHLAEISLICSFRCFHPFSFSVFFNRFSFVLIIVFHKNTLLTGCPARRVNIAITTGLTYFLSILLYICVVCLNRLYAEVLVRFK